MFPASSSVGQDQLLGWPVTCLPFVPSPREIQTLPPCTYTSESAFAVGVNDTPSTAMTDTINAAQRPIATMRMPLPIASFPAGPEPPSRQAASMFASADASQ